MNNATSGNAPFSQPRPTDASNTSTLRGKKRLGFRRIFKRRKHKSDDGSASLTPSVQINKNVQWERGWSPQNNDNPEFHDASSTTQDANSNQMRQSIFQTQTHKVPAEERLQNMPKPWLARTRFFKTMVDNAFTDIDADGSGDIDEKELYSGLLLIHLQLGAYAGPAACKPISREKCHAVFLKMDTDGSGRLDKEEFSHVMMVLFGNVMMRVLFQYAATLMVVPLLAKTILDMILLLGALIPVALSKLDPYTPVDDIIDRYWELMQTTLVEKSPAIVVTAGVKMNGLLEMIPDSVWSTIPLTLLSTLLSMMIIPWTLMKIDDYFQSVADQKGGSGNSKKVKGV